MLAININRHSNVIKNLCFLIRFHELFCLKTDSSSAINVESVCLSSIIHSQNSHHTVSEINQFSTCLRVVYTSLIIADKTDQITSENDLEMSHLHTKAYQRDVRIKRT